MILEAVNYKATLVFELNPLISTLAQSTTEPSSKYKPHSSFEIIRVIISSDSTSLQEIKFVLSNSIVFGES